MPELKSESVVHHAHSHSQVTYLKRRYLSWPEFRNLNQMRIILHNSVAGSLLTVTWHTTSCSSQSHNWHDHRDQLEMLFLALHFMSRQFIFNLSDNFNWSPLLHLPLHVLPLHTARAFHFSSGSWITERTHHLLILTFLTRGQLLR